MPIYRPKGKAGEYSPLALNIYKNCDHGCNYCYVPRFQGFAGHHTQPVIPRLDLQALEKEAPKYSDTEQVLLCFTCDPYCQADVLYQDTRKVLDIFRRNNILTAILTKGGTRCLRDLDLFESMKDRIKVGATLTFTDAEKSRKVERTAADPSDRFQALKTLHEHGIKTWVSLEPVIELKETLNVIKETHTYVDQYKLGLTNYYKPPVPIDWSLLLELCTTLFHDYGNDYYIKKDLHPFLNSRVKYTKAHLSPETLWLKPRNRVQTLF
ncbi:MAG: DNA repair photolyase [Siphoviridae sp. ctvD11]|nr:MAG: DNA repair photolyase [Siphoviridae sp. ctvD11]